MCVEFIDPLTGHTSCNCGYTSEEIVPCTECVNTPPSTSEEEGCESFTVCEYYYCDLALGDCGPDANFCNQPTC